MSRISFASFDVGPDRGDALHAAGRLQDAGVPVASVSASEADGEIHFHVAVRSDAAALACSVLEGAEPYG